MYRSLNSCQLFAQGICPEQKLVEKICLIPQFVTFEEYQRIRSSQCCIKDLVAFDDSLKIFEQHQSRRKAPRVEVSSTVHLQQADLNEIGGEIYNLSTGVFDEVLDFRRACRHHTGGVRWTSSGC